MSLRLRLTGLFTVLVVVLAATALVVVTALRTVERDRALVTETLQPASLQSRALLVAVVDQETAERGYVITGDEAFLDPYREGRVEFRANLMQLRQALAADPATATALRRVVDAWTIWTEVGAGPEIAARRAGDAGRAAALVRDGVGKAAFDNLRARIADLQVLIDGQVDRAQQDAALDTTRLRDVVLAAVALLALLLVLTGVMLRGWTLSPVLALRRDMREVAGGDLDRPVRATGPPEVAAIGRDAESMRRRIVEELERAQAATEALGQHSPVVAGLRRELAVPSRLETPGLDVAGRLQSAEGVLAGDWWDAVTRADGSVAVMVADVSGHGAEAGLVASRFKHRLTALLAANLDLHTVFELAARVEDHDDERFLACLMVVVGPEPGRLRWVNAGHPPALLARPDGSVLELGPTGPLVSSVTLGWAVEETTLAPGDLLVACTDGILEARDGDGEEFGTEGVLEVLGSLHRRTPAEAVDETCEAARRFALDARRDDVTCVALALAPGEPG